MKLVSQSQAIETIGDQVSPIRQKRKMRRQPRWDRIFILLFTIFALPTICYHLATASALWETKTVVVSTEEKPIEPVEDRPRELEPKEISRGGNIHKEEVVPEPKPEPPPKPTYKAYDKTDVSNRIYQHFTRRGYSHAATIGIMANLKHESQFDPAAHEYGGGPGRGLAQWGGGRFNALVAAADEKGVHWSDLDTQLEFLEREINSSDINNRMAGYTAPSMLYNNGVSPIDGGLEGFKRLTDPEVAMRVFEATMERSGGNGMSDRVRQTYSLDAAYR